MDRPSPPVPPRPASPLAGLGRALRRLRMQKGQRQFETAAAAGITKAMLSAYENGKRRPSLKTLDQILRALGADLGDLHVALLRERREATSAREAPAVRPDDTLSEAAPTYDASTQSGGGWRGPSPPSRPAELDLYRALGVDAPLPAAQERALSEMLVLFLRMLRLVQAGADELEAGRARSPFAG